MEHSEFQIGQEFWCSGRQWRCTDVGTRTVIAIRIDQVEVAELRDGIESRRILSREDAEAEGWFRGPHYAVLEHVFDEDDILGCTPTPDEPD